jgi:hypothetical protein
MIGEPFCSVLQRLKLRHTMCLKAVLRRQEPAPPWLGPGYRPGEACLISLMSLLCRSAFSNLSASGVPVYIIRDAIFRDARRSFLIRLI